jgi:hypothetical protein
MSGAKNGLKIAIKSPDWRSIASRLAFLLSVGRLLPVSAAPAWSGAKAVKDRQMEKYKYISNALKH